MVSLQHIHCSDSLFSATCPTSGQPPASPISLCIFKKDKLVLIQASHHLEGNSVFLKEPHPRPEEANGFHMIWSLP